MKYLRFLVIGLACMAVLLVIAVALAFNSGVQTWAAKKFSPASPELTVGIGRVDAGLHQTRVENVRVVQPGLVLTIPSAEIEVGVLDATGGKIEVKRLVAKGWILDLTEPGAPKSSGEKKSPDVPTTFDGLFKLIQLPFDLAVDGVDLAGEVILPEGRAQVTITGGSIAAGKDGKFTLTSDFKSGASALTVHGDIGAHMDTPRSFDRLTVAATAIATDPKLPQGARIDIAVTAARENEAEAYTVALRSGTRDIVHLDVKLPAGAAPLAGTWTLDATTADAAPFAMGQALPDFVAKGQGTFEADRTFSRIKTTGALDTSLDKLDVIQPEFAALGKLKLTAKFDAAQQGDVVRLNTLDVQIAGAQPVVSVTAAQVIEFNTATSELKAADASIDLLRITLNGVPLAWAKPFLGDIAMTGDDVRGTFTANARDGGFTLRQAAPITLTNLSVSQAGAPLVRALDVSLATQADYTPKGWTAEVTDLSVRSAGAALLKLTARASQDTGRTDQPLKAEGAYEVSLPALLAQPVAGGSVALKQGVARGSFSASVAKLQSATLTLQLADLVAADAEATPLPAVALQARADIDAAGRIDASVPVVISMGVRKSDLTLTAVVTPGEKITDIKAQLTGDTLNVPDLMLFSALSPATPPASTPVTPAAKPVETKTPPAPAVPLWDGVTGELKLAFKKIVYSKDIQVTGVDGLVKITPAALTLQNIQAALKTGGNLKAAGGLQFDAKNKQPYGLKADVVLTDIEPAPILRALSPGKPSPVEGKFDLKTQLSGSAVEPAGFTESVLGDIALTSKGGTFKALSVKTGAAVENAGRAADIAGLLGSLAGSDSTVKYAARARAAVDVTKQLGSIKFDELNLIVGRDEKNDLAIKDMTLISPLIRLVGSGQITNKAGVPLMQQPLLLNLKLGAADKLAADLRTLKLINDKADTTGYSSLVEDVILDGSLQSIGTKQLSSLIERALTN